MANKQYITKLEAKIIVFLKNADPRIAYASMIALKLQTDYGYLLRTISKMKQKFWIVVAYKTQRQIFYKLGQQPPINKAIELLGAEK